MSRFSVFVLLVAGCATGQRSLPVPDQGPTDLAGFVSFDAADDFPPPPDLSFSSHDLKGVDLLPPNADLSGVCLKTPKVNEVQTGGAGGGTDEWVELFNPCSNAFPLAGWTLKYRSATNTAAGDTYAIANLTGSIPAMGLYLVANSGYSGSATPDIKPFASNGMASTGGAVGLRDPNGVLVDSVGWGSANNPFVETAVATAPATSRSIARHPDGNDSDNNSTDFTDSTPTPKAPN